MSDKQPHVTHKDHHSLERDRHSNKIVHGNKGGPKKGGGGGKGTWGKGGLDDLKEVDVDPQDPIYDDDDNDNTGEVVITSVEVTTPVATLMKEYFASGDIAETLKLIKEFNITDYPDLVKKAIVFAMEKQAFERELVSQLLSALYGNIGTQDIDNGFQKALNAIDDIVLDNPDAVEVLSKFLARAVVDEIVPPRFLKDAEAKSNNASEAIALASALTTEKHRIDRLAHVWGPGDMSSVKRLKEETSTLLEEYLSSTDLNEADRCVRKLNAPSFHFQIVKLALRIALQRSGEDSKKIVQLLTFFQKSGLVSQDHIVKGFHCIFDSLNDVKLDFPHADKQLEEIAANAVIAGWLPSDWKSLKC